MDCQGSASNTEDCLAGSFYALDSLPAIHPVLLQHIRIYTVLHVWVGLNLFDAEVLLVQSQCILSSWAWEWCHSSDGVNTVIITMIQTLRGFTLSTSSLKFVFAIATTVFKKKSRNSCMFYFMSHVETVTCVAGH